MNLMDTINELWMWRDACWSENWHFFMPCASKSCGTVNADLWRMCSACKWKGLFHDPSRVEMWNVSLPCIWCEYYLHRSLTSGAGHIPHWNESHPVCFDALNSGAYKSSQFVPLTDTDPETNTRSLKILLGQFWLKKIVFPDNSTACEPVYWSPPFHKHRNNLSAWRRAYCLDFCGLSRSFP